jgi:hypothetical protein
MLRRVNCQPLRFQSSCSISKDRLHVERLPSNTQQLSQVLCRALKSAKASTRRVRVNHRRSRILASQEFLPRAPPASRDLSAFSKTIAGLTASQLKGPCFLHDTLALPDVTTWRLIDSAGCAAYNRSDRVGSIGADISGLTII